MRMNEEQKGADTDVYAFAFMKRNERNCVEWKKSLRIQSATNGMYAVCHCFKMDRRQHTVRLTVKKINIHQKHSKICFFFLFK